MLVRRLERAGPDDEVALLLQDPVHPVDRLPGLVRGLATRSWSYLFSRWRASLARSPASATASSRDAQRAAADDDLADLEPLDPRGLDDE